MTKTIAHFGAWKSPITSESIVASSIGVGAAGFDGNWIYWMEGRPQEGGRQVLVRHDADGTVRDVNPAPYNIRTRVHEYGGGTVMLGGGMALGINFADQRLYSFAPGAEPVPLTPDVPMRYADMAHDVQRNRLIVVREDHAPETLQAHGEAVNTIAALSLKGDGAQLVLVKGYDFYSDPQLSPDGKQLCWLCWNHPNMPWDGTELWLADVTGDGTLENARCVAGGKTESIFQPEWSPEGVLTFVSDRNGWWNLYRLEDGEARCVKEMAAEFGSPQWVFGISDYAYLSATDLVCKIAQNGEEYLARLDVRTGEITPFNVPYTDISGVSVNEAGTKVLFRGSAANLPGAVILLDVASGEFKILRESLSMALDDGYLSMPQALEFPTANGLTAYGLYYAPVNKDYEAPEGEKPPLLVLSHGGPTGSTSSALSLGKQYWTSRGFAVLDVNYGGSTGYGRAYRERLNGNWGIVDVQDCANGARYLVDQGLVDADRLAIRGGSAGGYTTLCALAFTDVFAAGASHYGVADLEALATDTHKFESRYLDNLVGPYPERKDLYHERSAIYNTEGLNCPVIFFQGLEDKVVPPAQAERMVAALDAKGIPVAYLPFEGEQHGFRRAENIKRALDAELYFYGKIFDFEPAEPIEPVEIKHL